MDARRWFWKAAAGLALCAAAARGVPWIDPDAPDAAPPAVQTSGAVAVNRWTNQFEDALKASGTLGRPAMVAIATSKETCKKCKAWYEVLESETWKTWIARHPMVLVFIDYAKDRDLYDRYHAFFKGEAADTWPTIAILEPGAEGTEEILAKLDEEDNKESIYPDAASFTSWLGEYVYGYESTAVALGETAVSTLHEGETFAGTVSRTGSDYGAVQATVRLTIDGTNAPSYPAQTVLWADGESGIRDFTFTFEASDAYEAPRQLQFLLSATNLAEAAMSISTNTIPFTITNGVDSVVTNDPLKTVTTNYNTTVTNRIEVATNFTANGSIALNYGRQSLDLTLLDRLESKTLAQFKRENAAFDSLTPDAGTPWFAGEDGLLRTPPLEAPGTEVSLEWQAPASGYLRYHLREHGSDAASATNVLSCQTGTNGWTVLASNILQPSSCAVAAGDKLKFALVTTASNAVPEFAELAFTPFAAAVTHANTVSDAVDYDAFAADPSLMDLSWAEPASAADNLQRSVSNRLFYTASFGGNAAEGTVELGPASATNACDAGMIAVDDAYAHGTLSCRLDWLADLSLFDFATRDEIWVAGETRTFSFSTKPAFGDDVPGEGASLVAYTKTATSISFAAGSSRPVAYRVSGLPSGMTFDAATGVLSGTPKKTGVYRIAVTATAGGDSEVRNVTLTVAKLPARLRNKAYGVLLDASGEVRGTAELSVSAAAKLKAKFTLRNGRASATATLESRADGSFTGAADVKGFSATMEPGGLWHGRYDGLTLVARSVKGVSFASVAGAYTLKLFAPPGTGRTGYGYLTAKIAKTGSVRLKGAMPDAKTFSVSARLIRATAGELVSAGIPSSALPGLSFYGADASVCLTPVFVKKTGKQVYALGLAGCASPKEMRFESLRYSGASEWTLASQGYPYRKKQTGAFAGKKLTVWRGDAVILDGIPLTGGFALSGAPAKCRLSLVPSTGVFTLKCPDGKKTVSVKGAAVTFDGTATGVGKSGKQVYHAVIE